MLSLASIALAFSSQPIPEEGCFNYYTGTCSGCGKPRMCGFSPHTDEQKTYSMPTYYTGNSGFCSHCPGGEGCWDGAFAGGPEHCTCVTEDRCIANSPAYVPCTECGADGPDPPLKQLPQPVPSPSPSPSPSPTEMGPFNVFEFKTKAAFDACDFSSADTSTFIPYDSPSASNKVPPVESNTVTFGTPTLVDDGPLGRPVRYFGGSPTEYCLAGQRLTAYGSAGPAAASTAAAREAAGLRGITHRNTQWGDPATWNAADGFTFSFVQADDNIIFDYPKNIIIEDESDESCNGVTYPDDGELCGITYEDNNVCSFSCEVGWDGLPPCKCASCGCYAGECCTNESGLMMGR